MSEFALGSEVYDPFHDPVSPLGQEMRELLDAFVPFIADDGLRNGYIQLNDVSAKVNGVCFEWAQNYGELRDRAVRLKGLYIVRRLERFINSGIQTRVSDYHPAVIYPNDDFWPRVEETTSCILEDLLQTKYGVDVKALPAYAFSDGTNSHKMADVMGYEIGKCISKVDGELRHFSYFAQPEGLPSDQKVH